MRTSPSDPAAHATTLTRTQEFPVSVSIGPEQSRQPGPKTGEVRVLLLGSTGSIGTQTLDTIAHLNRLADLEEAGGRASRRYRVVGLAAGNNAGVLADQAARFKVRDLALARGSATVEGAGADGRGGTRIRTGADAAERLVREVEADIVLAAMVGSAGLPATLAAVELGRDVALANKETLVAAGALVVPAARKSGSKLLPVDSEHAALWQCLMVSEGAGCCPPMSTPSSVVRAVITASGGPFRTRSRDEVYHATVAQALNHPTWSMGPKVTIDSASLTNKALEVIEAHWLFGLGGDRISAVVHPQSVVHAMVEFADGSVVAQLAAPDMRLPIQAALTHPERPAGVSRKLSLSAMSRLEFEEPDLGRFPALGLAWRVIAEGGCRGAVMNAANEAAVEAFLAGAIPFGRIPELTREALDGVGPRAISCLADVMDADAAARRFVRQRLGA